MNATFTFLYSLRTISTPFQLYNLKQNRYLLTFCLQAPLRHTRARMQTT